MSGPLILLYVSKLLHLLFFIVFYTFLCFHSCVLFLFTQFPHGGTNKGIPNLNLKSLQWNGCHWVALVHASGEQQW